jgi:hypothetical protein
VFIITDKTKASREGKMCRCYEKTKRDKDGNSNRIQGEDDCITAK